MIASQATCHTPEREDVTGGVRLVGPTGVHGLGEGSTATVRRRAAVGSAENSGGRVCETVLYIGVRLVLSHQEFVAVETVTKSLTFLPVAAEKRRGFY